MQQGWEYLEVAPNSTWPNIEGRKRRGKVRGGCARLDLRQRGGEGKLEPSIGICSRNDWRQWGLERDDGVIVTSVYRVMKLTWSACKKT